MRNLNEISCQDFYYFCVEMAMVPSQMQALYYISISDIYLLFLRFFFLDLPRSLLGCLRFLVPVKMIAHVDHTNNTHWLFTVSHFN